MYRRKRTGDAGDPCGRPHWIVCVAVVTSSSRIRACLSSMKEPTSLTSWVAQPCCLIRSMSRFFRVASNAPFTSTVRIEAVPLFSRECSISCVRQARRSEAARVGKAPACCGLTTLYRSVMFAIRLATSLSRPFPRQERSAIGRQERGFERSFLFGFRSITTSAVRNGRGWCPIRRQAWKSARTGSWIACQHAFNSRTEMPSAPGEVLLTAIVAAASSSFEM